MKHNKLVELINIMTASGIVSSIIFTIFNPFHAVWYEDLIVEIFTLIVVIALGLGSIKLINKFKVGS